LILRLLCKRLGEKYAPEQAIQSFKSYQTCYIKDNVFRVTYCDPIIRCICQLKSTPYSS